MTSITQDHNSGICHAASENRRQLLVQLKQLADEFENCDREVRNDRGKNTGNLQKECAENHGNAEKFKACENQIENFNQKVGKNACCGNGRTNKAYGRQGDVRNVVEMINYQNDGVRCGGGSYNNNKTEKLNEGFDENMANRDLDMAYPGRCPFHNTFEAPKKDAFCGTDKLNKGAQKTHKKGGMGKQVVNKFQYENENDASCRNECDLDMAYPGRCPFHNTFEAPKKDAFCGTDKLNKGAQKTHKKGGRGKQVVNKFQNENENDASCRNECDLDMAYPGRCPFYNTFEAPKKDAFCGTDKLNKEAQKTHKKGGRGKQIVNKFQYKNEKDTSCGNEHDRQNQDNEELEKLLRKCCAENNVNQNRFAIDVKNIETARDRCNDYRVGERQLNNSQNRENSVLCDKVQPIFQNCRPGCRITQQPQITFPDSPPQSVYKWTTPKGRCDHLPGQLTGGVLVPGCECTKRNGLQDQCRSKCHETESGAKVTLDC